MLFSIPCPSVMMIIWGTPWENSPVQRCYPTQAVKPLCAVDSCSCWQDHGHDMSRASRLDDSEPGATTIRSIANGKGWSVKETL